jgi:hypothetical protein
MDNVILIPRYSATFMYQFLILKVNQGITGLEPKMKSLIRIWNMKLWILCVKYVLCIRHFITLTSH